MAGTINDIININITRERAVPATIGFGWAAFVDSGADLGADKIREYANLDEVLEDSDLGANSVAFARLYFGQAIRPTKLFIIWRDSTAEPTPETFVQAITAARLINDDWYVLAIDSAVKADIEAVAAYIEPLYKVFLANSADVAVYDAGSTTDVAYALKEDNLDRTSLFYHPDAATDFVAGAPIGLLIPKQPGSVQWAYKTFSGISAATMTSGQRNAVHAKNANTYTDRANVSVYEQGKVASGEWIDVIFGIDWIRFTMENRVFTQFVNNDKIPFDDDGIQVIVSAVQSVLDEAVRRKILAASPAPQVTYPLASEVSSQNRADRYLPDINWSARLAGAIIKTQINGKVSV